MCSPYNKMEENNFLDYNPQFQRNYNNEYNPNMSQYMGARNSELEADALQRWLNPGIAEAAQFDRENFFQDKENAFTEYMWNKANEYNSETAKMERAKAAGINPNLMAAGIAGVGGSNAQPMQGAGGDAGINPTTANPIEMLKTLADTLNIGTNTATTLGNLFGFGEKNKAEIQLIRTNATKAAEECNYTRKQRLQLEAIGDILVNNARLEGKQITANIESLIQLNEVYKEQRKNIAADTNLKDAQTGTEVEKQTSLMYDNLRKEFEKNFRDMFGLELTHGQMQLLIEAFLQGNGETIIKYFTDTIAGSIKGLKDTIFGNKPKPNPVTTTNPNTGEKSNIEFSNKRERQKWQSRHLKNAKNQWERKGKKKGQSFDNFLKIYCSQRGLNITDLLND